MCGFGGICSADNVACLPASLEACSAGLEARHGVGDFRLRPALIGAGELTCAHMVWLVFHQLPPAVMMFHQSRAALHPVPIIHIGNAVNVADFGHVNMPAYGAVKAFALAVAGHLILEGMDVIHGPFRPFFQGL